jgi:hypothetical protein
MVSHSDNEVHRNTPPCYCPDCQLQTAAANQRRAEIQAILCRLDEANLPITTGDQLCKEAE